MRTLLVKRLRDSHGLQLGRPARAAASPARRAADSLVAGYLRSDLPCSQSVFAAEAGLDTPLGDSEVASLLGIPPGSLVGEAIAHRGSLAQEGPPLVLPSPRRSVERCR